MKLQKTHLLFYLFLFFFQQSLYADKIRFCGVFEIDSKSKSEEKIVLNKDSKLKLLTSNPKKINEYVKGQENVDESNKNYILFSFELSPLFQINGLPKKFICENFVVGEYLILFDKDSIRSCTSYLVEKK